MTDIPLSDIPFARPTPATLATVKHGGCVQLGDGLLPCPFCGAPAERIDFGSGSGDNEGGSCVACTRCEASGPVEFGYKETFISDWNRRALSAQPSPASSFDLEAMLAACVPGGSIVDPQVIADNIRQWFAAQPSPGGKGALQILADYLCVPACDLDMEHEISLRGAVEAIDLALDARQPVGEQPAIWVSPGQLAAHKDRVPGDGGAYLPARLTKDGQFTKPLYAAPPAQAVDLERARNEGHDGAIRYVLGYLCGMGDWGSTQYVEILNGCGRESIIRSAIEDGELEFTGLGRWVEERGTDEERALIASQAVGK